jgi:lipoprotein-releasing system permease protein
MYRCFLALRWLLSRPINLLGMAGVAVGVWALIVVVSIFSGFLREVRAHVQSATADVTVFRLPWPASFARLEPTILADPEVASCAPRLVWYGLLHAFGATHEMLPQIRALDEPGAESPFIVLLGIDAERERQVTGFSRWLRNVEDPAHRVASLDAPLPDGEQPAILLSERRLQREFVGRGAQVRITTARLDDGQGERLDFDEQDFTVAGAFATGHGGFDEAHTFVPIETLRAMLAAASGDAVTEITVRCKDPSRRDAVAQRLGTALNAARPPGTTPILAMTWEQREQAFLDAVDHQRSLMKLVLFVIMVVAGFLMYATLSMMVAEKTRDIGILTAMGGTRAGILQVFLACGLAITVVGAVLGVIAGCLSAYYLDDFNRWLRAMFGIDLFPTSIYNLERVPYDLDPLWIAQVAGLALALGVLVAGLPAWRAARHDPLQSLRHE